MDTLKKVRLRPAAAGEVDPLKRGFTFTLKDEKTGMFWCYFVKEEKTRRRKLLATLGVVGMEEGPIITKEVTQFDAYQPVAQESGL